MKPQLEVTLKIANRLGQITTVSITGNDGEAWVRIFDEHDSEQEERSVILDPQEIDVFISALSLFKHRILNHDWRKGADE